MKRMLLLAAYVVLCAVVGCLVIPPSEVGWASSLLFGLTIGMSAVISKALDVRVKSASYGASKAPTGLAIAVVVGIYCGVAVALVGALHVLLPSLFVLPNGVLQFALGMVGLPLMYAAWLDLISRIK